MKRTMAFLLTTAMALSLCACTTEPNESSSNKKDNTLDAESNYSEVQDGNNDASNYDYNYDQGYGYTAPEDGQSVSDYIKEQDPDLYDSMSKIYDDATSNNTSSSSDYDYDKGYGYTAPKDGQSLSDYIKEQDPDLYNSLFD